MKERKPQKYSHAIIIAITIMTLMATSLTGCSKEPATNEAASSSTEGTAESKADKTEQSTENAEVSSEAEPEPTVEATADATPEPTPEPVVYEGIDMESDLPGEEWIKTFIGVVDEPVVIVYNDNTGRKEIIQEGSVINADPDEDVFAIYLPEGTEFDRIGMPAKVSERSNYALIRIDKAEVSVGDRKLPKARIRRGGEEELIAEFTVIIE